MTAEDLESVLGPLFSDLHDKLDVIVEDFNYMIKIQCGLLVAIGVVAGLILISYLLDRF